jgi:D-psicose/D-tagatose/L-ribulose 3-epimerase
MAIGIGVNAWVWTSPFTTQDGPDGLGLLDKVKQMGFDSFEFGLEDPSHVDPAKLKAKAEQTGLKLVICGAFGPDRDLTHDDASVRENSLNYITKAIEICAKSGTPVLAGPMYSAVGKRRHVTPDQKKKEWDLAVKGMKEAGKRAKDQGVLLAIEPLNRFETDLINIAEQAKRLVDEVGDKTVGIHLDSFHMNIEEKNSADAIRLAGDRLYHFHACENDRGAPGSGVNIDWDGVAKALKDVGYSRQAVIESFTPKTKSIAAAAAIWRQFEPTQDALAGNGLAFLRKILK